MTAAMPARFAESDVDDHQIRAPMRISETASSPPHPAARTCLRFDTERPMPIAAGSVWGPIDLCFDRAKAAICD